MYLYIYIYIEREREIASLSHLPPEGKQKETISPAHQSHKCFLSHK